MSLVRWMGAFALVLGVARDANAVGSVLSSARDPATAVEARFAIAVSRARTTRWASLRVERFPGAMAWVLPVRPGARVNEVGDAWFEALEVATAPRVVGSGCAVDAGVGSVRIVRPIEHEATAAALDLMPIENVAALRAFAEQWALDLLPETAHRFEALESRGFSFVALVYGGSVDRTLTRTVRVTDDAFPAVPLFLTSGPASSALRVQAFFVAASRMRVGLETESEIDPSRISFSDAGATNYDDALLASLLGSKGTSWVVEAADRAFFFEGARGPEGAGSTAPLMPTYLERARAYGDATDDGDLSLSGLDPDSAWITRVAGIVPAREFGDDLAVTMTEGRTKSPFLVTRPSPNCSAADAGPSPPSGMPPIDAGTPPSGPPFPLGSTAGTGTTGVGSGEGPVGRQGASYPITTEGSCSCSPGADDTADSDSCDRSDASDMSSSDDGCDGSASDDDGADDGCDGTSSGSSSASDTNCAVSRHKRRGRSHTSVFAFLVAAVLLPLRRGTRPRR